MAVRCGNCHQVTIAPDGIHGVRCPHCGESWLGTTGHIAARAILLVLCFVGAVTLINLFAAGRP